MYRGLERLDIVVVNEGLSKWGLSWTFWPSARDCPLLALLYMSDSLFMSKVCSSNERLVCDRLKESSTKLGKLIQELDLSREFVICNALVMWLRVGQM